MLSSRTALTIALAAVATGCAPQLAITQRVDEKTYRSIPEAERATTAREDQALAAAREAQQRARAELAASEQALDIAELERQGDEGVLAKARADLAASSGAEPERVEAARHEVAIAEMRAKVLSAKVAWLTERRAWRQRMLEAADRKVDAADAALELDKALLVARRDPATEVERFRGQYARLHKVWSDARARVAEAHAAMDARERELVALKARYAELHVAMPSAPPTAMPPEGAPATPPSPSAAQATGP